MTKLIWIFLVLIMVGCHKPDPSPENKDPIYQDLLAQKASVQKSLDDVVKLHEEYRQNLQKVKPQTGQIKYAEKRFWKTQHLIDTYLQELKYLEIRIQERKKLARVDYNKAFKDGKDWPNPKETEEYMANRRLQIQNRQWNAKERIEKYQKEESKGTLPAHSEPAHH